MELRRANGWLGCLALAVVALWPLSAAQAQVNVNPIVFLQGALSTSGQMRTDLRAASLVSTTDPYVDDGAAQTANTAVLNATGNNMPVDWVVVELRSPTTPSQILFQKAAMLRKNGSIINGNNTAFSIASAPAGQYFVAVRHRNHLRVVSFAPLSLSTSAVTIDFTLGNGWDETSQVYSTAAAKWTMRCGDVIPDGVVKYTGSNNDRDPILARVGASTPFNVVAGYWPEDVNLDGVVKYTGSSNDRDLIALAVGGSTPSNTLSQNIPPSIPSVAWTASSSLGVHAAAYAQSSPPAIALRWGNVTGRAATGNFVIYRKAREATTWGTQIGTSPATSNYYVDTTAVAGTYYEYRILASYSNGPAEGYVASGIRYAPPFYRGKVILVVDSSLTADLTELKSDLLDDGWIPKTVTVAQSATPSSVRASILSEYNADTTNVKAVLLVGHVPVPYSGNVNPDGHPEHQGAWPADGYYGTTGAAWATGGGSIVTTADQLVRNAPLPATKFAANDFPYALTLAVGRVDLFNMPAFNSFGPLTTAYLIKLHQMKRAEVAPTKSAKMWDSLAYAGYGLGASAWQGFSSLIGLENIDAPNPYDEGQLFYEAVDNQGYLFSYATGFGGPIEAVTVGSSALYAGIQFGAVFNMSYGSWFGDWDVQNNFLKAPIAADGMGLASMYSGRTQFHLHHMGLGDAVGYSAMRSMNNQIQGTTYKYATTADSVGGVNGNVVMGLHGDPTLRAYYAKAPTNVSYAGNMITWTAPQGESGIVGYHVYRVDGGFTTPTGFTRLTTNPVTTTSFAPAQPSGTKLLVKTVKVRVTSSGSYLDESLGVRVAIP